MSCVLSAGVLQVTVGVCVVVVVCEQLVDCC